MANEEGLRRTAAARAKRTRTKHNRQADEMALYGWHSMGPEVVAEAVRTLGAISAGNPETAHGNADDVLLAIVPPEVRGAFEALRERCGGFWYA